MQYCSGPGESAPGLGKWRSLSTAEQMRRENVQKPAKWAGQRVPQVLDKAPAVELEILVDEEFANQPTPTKSSTAPKVHLSRYCICLKWLPFIFFKNPGKLFMQNALVKIFCDLAFIFQCQLRSIVAICTAILQATGLLNVLHFSTEELSMLPRCTQLESAIALSPGLSLNPV